MHTHPPSITSGENIGDSGLIQAFRAWKAQYKDESEFLLPELNYTRSVRASHKRALPSDDSCHVASSCSSSPSPAHGRRTSSQKLQYVVLCLCSRSDTHTSARSRVCVLTRTLPTAIAWRARSQIFLSLPRRSSARQRRRLALPPCAMCY